MSGLNESFPCQRGVIALEGEKTQKVPRSYNVAGHCSHEQYSIMQRPSLRTCLVSKPAGRGVAIPRNRGNPDHLQRQLSGAPGSGSISQLVGGLTARRHSWVGAIDRAPAIQQSSGAGSDSRCGAGIGYLMVRILRKEVAGKDRPGPAITHVARARRGD